MLVIPANAGIHNCQMAANSLDSSLRRNDELIGFSGNFSLSKCHSGQIYYSKPNNFLQLGQGTGFRVL